MASVQPRYRTVDVLKFLAKLGVVLAIVSWSGVNVALKSQWLSSVIVSLGIATACLALTGRKAPAPRCETCGRRISRCQNRESLRLCPACRGVVLSTNQHHRLAAQGFVIIMAFLLTLSFVVLAPFSGLIRAHFGGNAYPITALGLFVVLLDLSAASLVLHCLLRTWRMRRSGYALKVARACARIADQKTTFGLVSVHAFGGNDPTAILKEQVSLGRYRFESFLGQPLERERPLRFFVFGKRGSFDAFFKWAFLYAGNLDGIYVGWTPPTIAITTELPAHRVADPERMILGLIACFHLDSYRQAPSPLWVQMGIANVVAHGGDTAELARLNRKMHADLSRGSSIGTDLFQTGRGSLTRLLRDWQDFQSFRRYSQLVTQSSSIVAFLCSEPSRMEPFRAYLRDPATNKGLERTFEHYFGYGFEALLERWRFWVVDRGIGRYDAPPPRIREALLKRVIPIVQNRGAERLERIQAIRELGRVGYVLAADALIEVLASDDRIPMEELVWSLESISGRALGDDVQKWNGWLHQLPIESTQVTSQVM